MPSRPPRMLPGLYRVRPFVFLVLLLITLITSLAMGAFAQAPPVPTGVSAAGTTGSVTVTWSASTGATSYNIYRSTTSGGEGTAAYATGITGLTYTNSSLANGSSFFYTVAAVSSGGTSAQSSEVTARPLAQITTLSAKTGNGQITIRFTGVTGATSYNLYRGTSSGGEGTTPYLTGTTTGEIIDTGVTNGQTYYYKITAVFGSNSESTQSSEINATPSSSLPLSPTNLTATAGNNQVALNWSSSFNATGYTVYRGTASGQTITSIGTTTNLTTYTDTTALNGHIYYYVVTATNASGESAYSNEASATLTGPPGAPIGLAAASISASQITLTWSSAPLANTISIWRSPDGSTNWTQIASVGSHTVTYTDSGLSANTAYYYYLQSIGTVGNSPPTSTVSATTWVAAPTGLTATSGLGQVSLTWNAVAGATGYNVKRATNAGTFTTLSSPTATSYTDTTGTNGTVYYYIVTATNTLGESAASNTVSATPYAAETGVQLQINAGGSAVSPYVADIDYSGGSTVSTGNSIDLSGVTNPAPLGVYQAWRQGSFSYTIPGLTVGAAYIVRLHFAEPTYSFGAQRVFSVAINSTTVLPNFDIVSAAGGLNKAVIEQFNTTANSSGQITIAFASVSGDVPLVNGIEVLSGAGVPSAPINLFANPGFTQAILTWNTVNGATSYKVYRATQSGGPYTSSFTASSNTYTNTGLTNGTTYYYVVTAVNAQGESVPSNQVQATPISSHASLYRINAGGFAVGSFAADTDFSGGSTLSSGNNIDLSAVTNPAPLAVYQTARTGAFTYTLPGLGVGATYTVRLHFADFNNSASGTRIFNVAINGTTVLSNFDIIAVAGSANKAVIEQFNTTANSSGQITIQLTAVSGSPPQVNGIEVLGGASAPSAPLQLTATAGNAQVALTWNAVNGATSYNIKRATVSGGPYTTISSPTSATYTDTSVTNGTTYYYVVTAVNASGESASSNEARAKPNTYNVGAIYRINCGGTTVGAFNADQYWSGTNTGAYSNGNNVDLTSATGPAPEAVYQSERQGYGFSYTFTGLAASTPYTVRLHFADITHQFPGQDVMSIVANGTTILSNLDVIAAAGGPNKALVEQSTVTSDASGNIALVFNNVTDYAFVNGIEILTGSSLPPAPSKLTATAGNAQVALSWTAVSGATSYNLKRATVSGGPYTTITSPTGTSYTDTGVTNGTTYYYVVTAVNTQGESLPSSEANATPQSANSAVYRINSGGTAVGLFSADQYFDNGGTAVTSNFIDTSMVANPAPQAVYQSFHRNSFTYTFSNLTPSGSYTVRLHFADLSSTAAGQNSTTVWINGTTVITSLDIYAAAGGANKALIEQLVANANASGVLTVSFLNGASGAGQINGIEILNGTMGPGNPVCVTAVPGNAQATITWNAVPNATSYTVRRATAAGGFYTTVGSPTTTTYTDTGLTNGTVYYYVVFAVNSYGQSATSNQASVVPAASGAVVQINAGGGAVSPFATDQDYDNAGSITTSNTVDTTAVALPAPQSVYQSAHQYGAGGFTYTIPGLTPSANYTVRLHFAEINYLYAGIRVFNVSINGTSVLSNFDIVGTAGSWNKAVVEQFNTSANSSGNIVVAFTPVTSLPIVNGIEIVGGSSRPIAPLGLTALLGSGGAQLTWQSVPGATGYNVYRTATSHTAYTKINTSTVTTTSYLDTGASATSPNYYVVTALNSVGESPQSAEAQTTPALTLSASGALVATVLGSSTNSILTASCSPGFAGGTVALTLSGVPTGVMAWLSPSSVTVSPPAGAAPSPNPPGIAKATLYLIATTGASSGTYTITVTATSGTYSVSVPVNLTIRSFDPTSLFRKGKSVTQNIGVVSQDTLSVPSIASEKGARK